MPKRRNPKEHVLSMAQHKEFLTTYKQNMFFHAKCLLKNIGMSISETHDETLQLFMPEISGDGWKTWSATSWLWLFAVGDCTTQLYRGYNKPL